MTPTSRRRERKRKERYEETGPGAFALSPVTEEMQQGNATEEARNTMPLDTSLKSEPNRKEERRDA
jgi:hypothetical protein